MSVNAAFVKAITTIKTLTKSPNALGKPPVENKTVLYGLYKQATEGDVQGIMARPEGQSPQQKANQRKWDAWKQQEGLTKDEAKLKYIEYLLETMRQVSPDTPQSRALLNELMSIYIAAKNGTANSSGTPGTSTPGGAHQRTWSNSSSAYGQFLRRPTYSEFGLSMGDRTERMSEISDLPNDPGIHGPEQGSPGGISYADPSWQSNVSWQLETITEEINSIRRRYEPSVSEPKTPLRRPSYPAGSIGGGGDHPSGEPAPSSLRKLLALIVIYGRRVFRRMAIDMAAVTLFLILVRVVQGSPGIMSRIPITRKLFSVIGNVIAVVLREVGFEIKPREKPASA